LLKIQKLQKNNYFCKRFNIKILTQKEYISLLKNPENVNDTHIVDLRTMLETFPFLASARILLSLALKKTQSVDFPLVAQQTALYVSDRRRFYFLLSPEKPNATVANHVNSQSAGEYFDMLEKIERSGGDTRQSLRSLAEKLKDARHEFSEQKNPKEQNKPTEQKNKSVEMQPVEKQTIKDEFYWSQKEKEAKKFIIEKKYSSALEILYEINLNIPKKSIYFADQIRFLEKILQISNNK